MNTVFWLQIGLLTAEVLTTAFLFVLVFRARGVLGYVPLYVTVGAFQFVQTLLSLSVYVPVAASVQISPGSTVMLPATIFAVLLVYIAEDAPEARRLIYGVVIANIALSVLAVLFGAQLVEGRGVDLVDLPPDMFRTSPRVMLFGTVAMFFDVVLVIVFYEAVSKVLKSTYLRLLLSATAVLWLDTLAFVGGSFLGQPDFDFVPVLLSGMISKTFSAAIYAAVFAAFVLRPGLNFGRRADGDDGIGHVFGGLTYRQRYEQAREMALRDPLTGLYNRRYFQDNLEREAEHAVRYETPLALLLLDVDHFKDVNDRYGHQEGDRALKLIAAAISRTVRGVDIACRVGGEEFAVIAPRATEEVAALLADRIREAVVADYREAEPPFGMDRLTVTVGLAAIDGDQDVEAGESLPDRLFMAADQRMYVGKRGGRDRVVDSRTQQALAEVPAAEV